MFQDFALYLGHGYQFDMLLVILLILATTLLAGAVSCFAFPFATEDATWPFDEC